MRMRAEELDCLVPGPALVVDGAAEGPLRGLDFVAKDLFAVAGQPTGAGNPSWLATHPAPEDSTAPALLACLDAGARLVGKTITDDLACGMFGENVHYGTPLNPKHPERVPGGSSSGSVSAVAGGLAEFAIGTDTGGSIRVPASFCGVYGIRPSHGRIPLVGCVPMAPTFDTCGWFARDAATLRRVGEVLLPWERVRRPRRLVLAEDVLAWVEPEVAEATRAVAARLGATDTVRLWREGPEAAVETFWPLMSRQLWNANGSWFRRENPVLVPGLAERFVQASGFDGVAFTRANERRNAFAAHLEEVLDDDTVAILPTTHAPAPLKGQDPASLIPFRQRTLAMVAIASLGRLPQISLPLMQVGGLAQGLSLIGAFGSDRMLLALAEEIAASRPTA